MKWTVVQSGLRALVSHTMFIAARQAFTQHSNDVIQSQRAPPVPEDTSPAVLSKALVDTHLHVHGLVMHACNHMCTQT